MKNPETEAMIAGIEPATVNRVLLWAVQTLCERESTVDPALLNRMGTGGVTARDIYTLGHSAALFELRALHAESTRLGQEP